MRSTWERKSIPRPDPARILGVEAEIGSLEVGKRADLLALDTELNVKQVYVGGQRAV